MSIKLNNMDELWTIIRNQKKAAATRANRQSATAGDIIQNELLYMVINNPGVAAQLMRRLICRNRESCLNKEQGECPLNHKNYEFPNFCGCDVYTQKHPMEVYDELHKFINKEGLEL